MQCVVKMADLPEDEHWSAVGPLVPSLSNDFIPQRAEVVLEFGASVVYFKLGEHAQDV